MKLKNKQKSKIVIWHRDEIFTAWCKGNFVQNLILAQKMYHSSFKTMYQIVKKL